MMYDEMGNSAMANEALSEAQREAEEAPEYMR